MLYVAKKTKGIKLMTQKQKQALDKLRNRVQEDFGPNPVSIEDIISVARNKLKFGIPRIAAIFELNKDDIHRFLDKGLVPPYFERAFRRYFTLNKVYNYEYEY